jgi:hypothetical protein
MEITFIVVLFTFIVFIIIKIIEYNLDIITKNNLKIIEISDEVEHISDQLRKYTNKNSIEDSILEEIEDIYAAIKCINNEIMLIKNKIF